MSTSSRYAAGTRKAKRRPSLRRTHRSDRAMQIDLFRALFEDAGSRARRTIAHPADCWPSGRVHVESAGARARARSNKGRDAGFRAH